jgi:hypothetical protein
VVPQEAASLQGKKLQGPGVRALWGQQWTRLPFFHTRKKDCHNGGMAFDHRSAAATDRHHGERHWAGNADAFLLRTTLLNITTPRRGTIRDRNQPRMALSTVTTFAYSRGTGVRRRCAAWLEQDLERELRRAAATQHVASLLEIGVGGGELCRFGLVEA